MQHNMGCVALEAGDAAIFSSRVIPGNELSINRLHNDLAKRGVEVITDRDEDVHVSGHPARDELAEMYQMVRPRIALPVHGEARHIQEHVAFARECQVPEALAPENGTLAVRVVGIDPELHERDFVIEERP